MKRKSFLLGLAATGLTPYARGMYFSPKPQGLPDVKRIVETASNYGIIFPGLGLRAGQASRKLYLP